MNKEERLRALMHQRGELLPQEEKKTSSGKNGNKTSGTHSRSVNRKKQSVSKNRAAQPGRAGTKKTAAKKTADTVKRTRTGPAAKKVSNYGVSLSSHKQRQLRQQQKQAKMRLGLYAGALLVLILVIVLLSKSCKGPGDMTEVNQDGDPIPKTTEIQLIPEDSGTEEESRTEAEMQEQEMTNAISANATPPVVQTPPAVIDASAIIIPNWIAQQFIRVNEFSRPQIPLNTVEHIAIHWVGNPGSSAMGNREYFDNLGNPEDPAYGKTKASAHFVVGLEGEIIQCMPLTEMAYAVRDKFNPKTISIEVCHPDWEGKFTDVTYNSVVKLAAWLMQKFGLEGEGAILRHHDCDGKDCPKYYVNNPDEWKKMQQDILNYKAWNPSIG